VPHELHAASFVFTRFLGFLGDVRNDDEIGILKSSEPRGALASTKPCEHKTGKMTGSTTREATKVESATKRWRIR
jgi:hypothetical protein